MTNDNWKFIALGYIGGTLFSMFAFGIGYYFSVIPSGD